jgi:hypothetical protein
MSGLVDRENSITVTLKDQNGNTLDSRTVSISINGASFANVDLQVTTPVSVWTAYWTAYLLADPQSKPVLVFTALTVSLPYEELLLLENVT